MGDAKARDRASLLTKYKNLMTKSKNLRICKCNDQENDKKNDAFTRVCCTPKSKSKFAAV